MSPGGPRRDGGLSLIEVLVAVTLLGLVVAGVLPALWSSARGSGLQDDFAGARRWIVTAADQAVSAGVARIPCYAATADSIRAGYETAIRAESAANRPEGWGDSQLAVTGVRFSDGVLFPASGCFETPTLRLPLQLISLRVTDPDGAVVETLEVVKG